MASNVTKLEYNGLIFEADTPYNIPRLTGVNGVPYRTSEQVKTGADGGFVFKVLKSPRTIEIIGNILMDTADEYFDAERALILAFQPTDVALPLYIRLWNGSEKIVYCYTVNPPIIDYQGGQATYGRYRIALRAEDPDFFGPDSDVFNDSTDLAVSGGTPVPSPVASPISGGSNGEIIFNNDGDASGYAKFTIAGPVINPSITVINANGTNQIAFTTTLVAGESIIIEVTSAGESVTKNGVNWFQYMTGTIPEITVGSNVIKFTSSIYNSAALLFVEYRKRYLTVTS